MISQQLKLECKNNHKTDFALRFYVSGKFMNKKEDSPERGTGSVGISYATLAWT